MKKIPIKGLVAVAAGFAISLTACKKESIQTSQPVGKTTTETEKKPVYTEGIKSNDGYSTSGGVTTLLEGYYELAGTVGQQPVNNVTIAASPGTGVVKGLGATTGRVVYAYRDNSGQQYLECPGHYMTAIFDASYNTFVPVIEEIELDPQNALNVYLLVTESNAKRIYVVDVSTGVATLVTVNGYANAFNNIIVNGYKSGSITFVPNGLGTGFEFVFTTESTVYASLGIVSWHFTLSGTNLTSVTPHNRTYNNASLSGTGGINTTYGGGKLYFARDGSASNAVYSLDLTTNNTIVNEGFSVTNKNDFGYYKAY